MRSNTTGDVVGLEPRAGRVVVHLGEGAPRDIVVRVGDHLLAPALYDVPFV